MKHIVVASAVAFGAALFSGLGIAADPTADSSAAPKAPARLQPLEHLAQPPDCLQETGTHIAPKDGCVSMANGRSYDREQLTSNRELTMGGVLGRDPAITIQNHH